MSLVTSRSNTRYPRPYSFTVLVEATYLVLLPEPVTRKCDVGSEGVVSKVRYDIVPVHRSLTECSVVFAYKAH